MPLYINLVCIVLKEQDEAKNFFNLKVDGIQ